MDYRFITLGLIVFCVNFISIFGYEKCTHGWFYYYCSVGSCCLRDGTWKCELYDLSDCESLAKTTERPPTTTRLPSWLTTTHSPYWWTKSPTTRYPDHRVSGSKASRSVVLPVAFSIGICVLVLIIGMIGCYQRIRRKNTNETPRSGQILQPPMSNPIYHTSGQPTRSVQFTQHMPTSVTANELPPPYYLHASAENINENSGTYSEIHNYSELKASPYDVPPPAYTEVISTPQTNDDARE